MICLSMDNTRVCSCQRGEIIYSIKSQVRADKQKGWMFIYETSRWRDDMAVGGLRAPQDPPVAAPLTLCFIRFWYTYFQMNCSFLSGSHSLNSESWKFFHFLQRQEKQFVGGTPSLANEWRKEMVWLWSLKLNYPLQMTSVTPRAKHFKHK